jgi:hypothetical protein
MIHSIAQLLSVFFRRFIMNDTSPARSIAASQRRPINLPLGRLLSTPGAIDAMAKASHEPMELINRHRSGDWGEVDAEDWAANDRAISHGRRIPSAYTLKDGVKVWIITEADRSVTTILLPSEY